MTKCHARVFALDELAVVSRALCMVTYDLQFKADRKFYLKSFRKMYQGKTSAIGTSESAHYCDPLACLDLVCLFVRATVFGVFSEKLLAFGAKKIIIPFTPSVLNYRSF